MGYGNCVLTLATPENLEAVGEAGIPYADEDELAAQLQRVLRDGSLVSSYRQRAQSRVRERYDWEHVVDCYENLFAKMTGEPMMHDEEQTFVETAMGGTHDTAEVRKHSLSNQSVKR